MKGGSTSLIIREFQNKPQGDITSHLSEQLPSISPQTTSAGEVVEKGDPVLCGWERRLVQPLWKQYGVSSEKEKWDCL